MRVAAQQIVVMAVTGSLGHGRDHLGSRFQPGPAHPLKDHLAQLDVGHGGVEDHQRHLPQEQGGSVEINQAGQPLALASPLYPGQQLADDHVEQLADVVMSAGQHHSGERHQRSDAAFRSAPADRGCPD
jgi:hypothetical protein